MTATNQNLQCFAGASHVFFKTFLYKNQQFFLSFFLSHTFLLGNVRPQSDPLASEPVSLEQLEFNGFARGHVGGGGGGGARRVLSPPHLTVLFNK